MASLLGYDDLIAGDAGSGHHHDERYIFVAGGDHGRDDSAFAVADQADFVGIDFGTRFQIGDAGFGVGGEIGGGAGCEISGGLGGAAVVGAQHGDSVAGEVVGENEETACGRAGSRRDLAGRSR